MLYLWEDYGRVWVNRSCSVGPVGIQQGRDTAARRGSGCCKGD